jgi:hypothetical protein
VRSLNLGIGGRGIRFQFVLGEKRMVLCKITRRGSEGVIAWEYTCWEWNNITAINPLAYLTPQLTIHQSL